MPDPTDLQSLQQMLSFAGAGGTDPNTTAPPNMPPPQVDLGTGAAPTGNLQPQQQTDPGVGMQPAVLGQIQHDEAAQQAAQEPPKPNWRPNFMNLIDAITGKGTVNSQPGGPLSRPVSRLDAFEGFLGNFLNSFATGMQQGGTGPGASGRGFGAAVMAPYNREVQQYQMGQQQQLQQSQVQEQQARAAESQARTAQMGQMVTLPNGVTMPYGLAQKVYPQMVAGQAKVAAAGTQKRFMSTPFGIFDTKAGQMVQTSGEGIAATVKMTQEMADSGEFGPGAQQMVGKDLKIGDAMKMQATTQAGFGFPTGSEGPAREKKVGPTGSLGIGSAADNPMARANLGLKRSIFERDTFGQLFGPIKQKYPELASMIDDQGDTIGWKSPAGPTASIKTKAQTASGVVKLMDHFQTQLDAADKAGLLGPGRGRLNEWITGGLGGDDPQFAELRALASMVQTGTLNAHFGAKGASQVLDHFKGLLDTGKMTYGDLTGSLRSLRSVMQTYAGEARTNKQGPGAPSPAAKTGGATIHFTPVTPGQ